MPLSAPAGSCRMQKVLKCGHCPQLLRGNCRVLAVPHTSPDHTDTAQELLCPESSGAPPALGVPHTDPTGVTCAKEKVFSKPGGQDLFSGVFQPDTGVQHTPCRAFGVIWGIGGRSGTQLSFPPCLCTLDTLTSHHSIPQTRHPLFHSKFNSPSKAGSQDELTRGHSS